MAIIKTKLLQALDSLGHYPRIQKAATRLTGCDITDDQHFEVLRLIMRINFQIPEVMTDAASRKLKSLAEDCADHISIVSEQQQKSVKSKR